jgi:hypothetical protein
MEFDIPPEATRIGEMNVSWSGTAGRGGNVRGCRVAEE